MDYTKIAKTSVNTLSSYGVGRVVSTIVTSTVPRQDNPILDAAVKLSVIVTSWSVAGTIMEPVARHNDRKIDEISDAIKQLHA